MAGLAELAGMLVVQVGRSPGLAEQVGGQVGRSPGLAELVGS